MEVIETRKELGERIAALRKEGKPWDLFPQWVRFTQDTHHS